MKFSKYNLIIKDKDKDRNILFNTLYGECFEITDETTKIIENKQIQQLDDGDIILFKEKSIIIEDNINENNYVEYFHNKAKFNNDSLSFTVLLTWACNLRCVYCYEGAGDLRNKSLNADECESIIAFMKERIKTVRPKNISIMLFGGEPLLNVNAGKIILKSIKQLCDEQKIGFSTAIITNGVLLNKENIQFLKEYKCQYVQITLDGTKDVHDARRVSKNGTSSFDSILKTLKQMNARKDFVKPLIRINVDKTNVGKTEQLLKYLKEEGLNSCGIDFGVVRSTTNACASYSSNCFSERELGSILESLWELAINEGFKINPRPLRKFVYCGLNKETSYTIAPTLDIYKCWEEVGEEVHKIGTIEKNGNFKENTYNIIDWMSINPNMVEECKECVYLPTCGGGCAAQAYQDFGTYHGKGCFRIKGVIEKQLLHSLKDRNMISDVTPTPKIL